MKVILITDTNTNKVISVKTLKRFRDEVNEEYWKANNFCGDREYFKIDNIDFAIDWYTITSNNLAIDIMKLETSLEDEVRFWVKDSMNINVHHEIPEEERLKMLPIRNLKIEIGDISGELHDCRIIDYKNTGRISILVNEIK